MKSLLPVSAFVSVLVLSISVQAATKWWDVNGSIAGSGQGTGPGTWNTTGQNWTTDSNGLSSPTTFASGDLATFSAGTDATNAFTINAPSGVTTGGITVEEGLVSLSGSAINIGTNVVAINNGAKLSIPNSANISGSAGSKIVLNSGTIENTATGVGGSFVGTVITISLNGGGTLSATATGNNFTIVQVGTPGTVISGTGPLIKSGAGVIAIATACTYSGATIISNGEFRIRTTPNRLPVGTTVTVNSPGILNLNSVGQEIAGLSGNGAVGLGSATLTVGSASDSTFDGTIVDLSSLGTGGVTNGHGNLKKQGAGTLTLTALNGYSGTTTISAGTLALGASGSINGTSSLSIAAGATFDVSAIPTFNLSSLTSLSASGMASPALIVGGTTVNLGSRPITLAFDGAHPSLTISQGTLALNGNAITVNSSSHLQGGVYTIMQQSSGSISAAGSFPVSGTAIGSNYTAAIQISGGNVNLVLTPSPANITSVGTQTNGTAQLSFSGAPGQIYLVQATTNLTPPISWVTLSTNTAGTNGLFNFNDADSTNHPTRFYHTTTP